MTERLPRGSTVTVLGAVELPGVSRPARRIEIEWPSGATEQHVQIGGRDGFGEVEG